MNESISDHNVVVVGGDPGAYKFDGRFHLGEPGKPIKDESGKLCGVTKPRTIVHVHSLGGEAKFFQGIAEEGKLFATQCKNKNCPGFSSIYLPFRIFCPDCLGRMEVVDLTNAAQENARVYTFIVTSRTGAFNTLKTPIRFIDIEIPGVVTILKSYLLGPTNPEIGMRVVPIFKLKNPTYTIKDLAWVPADMARSRLPEEFWF